MLQLSQNNERKILELGDVKFQNKCVLNSTSLTENCC